MNEPAFVADVGDADFQSAVVERSESVPVLVDFWAEWCAPCKSLMPVLEKLAADYRGGFVLARVNADQETDLVRRVGVRSLPTVLLVKGGQVVDHFQGALPEGQVRAFLDRHVERPGQQGPAEAAAEAVARGDYDAARQALETALQEHPEDAALRLEMAAVLAAQGEVDAARAIVDTLPDDVDQARLAGVRARLDFATRLAGAAPVAELQARLETDPADSEAAYQLATHAVAAGDYDTALSLYMDLARRDRAYGEDAARKALLELFELLGSEDPRVKEYRRRLFTLMY
ncbi:co-chaperone YbbN [Ectothiorhodospiraceae bacterium WFHF3C12]|nr:co-chaperone YbbN [Ectothiorhodospiraceae bacterium WFHF3C12]